MTKTFFSVITKNLNWEILTKNLVTFKRWDGVKDEKKGELLLRRVDTQMHIMITQEGPYFFINFLTDTRNMFVMTSTEKLLC